MPQPQAAIDYAKCRPRECGDGICLAAKECPNKILRQESAFEYPFSHPSRYCRGCAKCAQACPFGAVKIA
ncbi:MAG: hypothetical protein FJ022_04910 [Chloroflexi bacterium]|nr:hypothetical protein [Chloroflexota bacterium]MBM3173536.1 hypothetical protein [Chloroflexota bacterium]MBM3175518.1 hypothetical protein [Chloroflexota bacterium]MBM4450131.1 hypothetical protein [Chloroflexota bacterium]